MTVLFRASYWLWPHFILNLTWPFWYRFTFRTCSGVSFSSLATCSIIDSMKNTTWLEAKRTKTISVKKKNLYLSYHNIPINRPRWSFETASVSYFTPVLSVTQPQLRGKCLLRRLATAGSNCFYMSKKNFSSTTFIRRNLRIFIKKSAKIVHIVDR